MFAENVCSLLSVLYDHVALCSSIFRGVVTRRLWGKDSHSVVSCGAMQSHASMSAGSVLLFWEERLFAVRQTTPVRSSTVHLCITQSNAASASSSSSSRLCGLQEQARGCRAGSNLLVMSRQGSDLSDQPSAHITGADLPLWWSKRHFIDPWIQSLMF